MMLQRMLTHAATKALFAVGNAMRHLTVRLMRHRGCRIAREVARLFPIATVAMIAFGSEVQAEEPLRLLTPFQPGSPLATESAHLADALKSTLGPNVVVTYQTHPDVIVNRLQKGQASLAVVPLSALVPVAKAFQVYNQFFLFKGLGDVISYQTGAAGKRAFDFLERADIKPIAHWHVGMQWLLTKKKVEKPEDLRTLRDFGTFSPFLGRQIGAFGTQITTTEDDLLIAFKNGNVEGIEINVATLADSTRPKIDWGYVTASNHRYVGYLIAASKTYWDSLPSERRDRLQADIAAFAGTVNESAIERAQQIDKHGKLMSPVTETRIEFSLARVDPSAAHSMYRRAFEPYWDKSELNAEAKSIVDRATTPPASFAHTFYSDIADGSPAAGSGPERSVYWNVWVESEGKTVDALEIEDPAPYMVQLDLSPFDYQRLLTRGYLTTGTMSDAHVKATLARYSQHSKKIELLVRPIAVGNHVAVAMPKGVFEPLTVDLQRFGQPETLEAKKADVSFLSSFARMSRQSQFSPRELAKNIRGGLVSFAVTPKAVGCATIAFSVWLKIGGSQQPLDHLVFRIPVRKSQTDKPPCDNKKELARLSAGLGTLLSGAVSRIEDAEFTADAGLHIFEHGVGKAEASIAVLVARRDATGAVDVFSWQTESIISTFIENRTQLPDHVRRARIAAYNDDREYPYADVAELLRLKLFSGQSDDDKKQAEQALKTLQNLAAQKARPRVAARLYSFRNEPLYIPLNLLSARSANPILMNPIAVLQPLPRESYLASRVCIGGWTFGIPDQLGDADRANAVIRGFVSANAHWLLPRLRDRKDAMRFFETQKPREGGNRSEGFLLLAHQGNGQLWFNEAEGKIQKEHIKRKYPEGSVAILTACSTANQSENNSEILNKLNQQDVHGMVVSPFPVDAEYSAWLAVGFAQAIKVARDQRLTLSLVELFEHAVKLVTEGLKVATDTSISSQTAEDMAREFLIIGDHTLRLCVDF